MDANFYVKNMSEQDFEAIIKLGNGVHGDGYLDHQSINEMLVKSIKDDLNSSYALYDNNLLVGFRITYAPTKWVPDQWCSPQLWSVKKEHIAYLKCNTIHPDYQGKGLGGQLLNASVSQLKKMGAKAGLSHIWMQSPGNASYKYFTKAGGKLIKTHARRWNNDPALPDYMCIICGKECYCDASEMLLEF